MKILHIVHTPRFSGAEMLVLELTQLHAKMGHTSKVVSMFPKESDFSIKISEQLEKGINWITPEENLSRFEKLKFLRKNYKNYSPQIVFAHSVIPSAYSRLSGMNNVISVLHSEDDYREKKLALSEFFLQFFLKGVIAVSPVAEKLYGKRFQHPKLECIPNGIDVEKYKNSKDINANKIIEAIGIDSEAIIALQVGRISNVKQQYLSVKSMAPVIQKNRKVHLLIAGILEDKIALEKLRAEIDLHGIKSNVHLLGPRADVANLLSLAHVYLMPSKQEAHSVALLEALASGVAIVASNITAFKYAKDLGGVVFVDPNNNVAFTNAIERSLNEKGRHLRNLEKYNISITSRKYIDIAKRVIEENR